MVSLLFYDRIAVNDLVVSTRMNNGVEINPYLNLFSYFVYTLHGFIFKLSIALYL